MEQRLAVEYLHVLNNASVQLSVDVNARRAGWVLSYGVAQPVSQHGIEQTDRIALSADSNDDRRLAGGNRAASDRDGKQVVVVAGVECGGALVQAGRHGEHAPSSPASDRSLVRWWIYCCLPSGVKLMAEC